MIGQSQFLLISAKNYLKSIWGRKEETSLLLKKFVENFWEDEESVCHKAGRKGLSSLEENPKAIMKDSFKKCCITRAFWGMEENILWKTTDINYYIEKWFIWVKLYVLYIKKFEEYLT